MSFEVTSAANVAPLGAWYDFPPQTFGAVVEPWYTDGLLWTAEGNQPLLFCGSAYVPETGITKLPVAPLGQV